MSCNIQDLVYFSVWFW